MTGQAGCGQLPEWSEALLRASMGVPGAAEALDTLWEQRRREFAVLRSALEAQMRALETTERAAAAAVSGAQASGAAARAIAEAWKPWGLDPKGNPFAGFGPFSPKG